MEGSEQDGKTALSFPNLSISQELVPAAVQKTLCYLADCLKLCLFAPKLALEGGVFSPAGPFQNCFTAGCCSFHRLHRKGAFAFSRALYNPENDCPRSLTAWLLNSIGLLFICNQFNKPQSLTPGCSSPFA